MNENKEQSASTPSVAALEGLARYRDFGGFGVTHSQDGEYVKFADVERLFTAAGSQADLRAKLASTEEALASALKDAENMRETVGTVCEGWTLPKDARKVLETALWADRVQITNTASQEDKTATGE